MSWLQLLCFVGGITLAGAWVTIYRALDKPLWMGAVWIVAVVCLVFSHIPEALIPPLAYGVGIGSVAAWLAPHLFKWNRLDL